MAVAALAARAVLETRKKHKNTNFHPTGSKFNLKDEKHRLILILAIVAAVVLILFLIGLIVYGRRERARKKVGKKPRIGRVLLKSLLLATLLAIPIWLVKKCIGHKKTGKYNKLEAAAATANYNNTAQTTQTQTQWYGNDPAAAPTNYAGAGPVLHGYGADVKGQQPYDAYSGGGYAPPKYDPPASMPEDRAVSPASGVHQPPPPPEGR